jgi:hypothetical protein
VTLADTPATWSEGPFISTLHALAIFVGIPLLVILTVSLLVYAPSWARGPRYRPGQPWQSKTEWFGASVAADPPLRLLEDAGPGTGTTGSSRVSPVPEHPDARERSDGGSGGASATW